MFFILNQHQTSFSRNKIKKNQQKHQIYSQYKLRNVFWFTRLTHRHGRYWSLFSHMLSVTFQNIAKQNNFQAKTMFTTGETVGLAEWIIVDTYLVFLTLTCDSVMPKAKANLALSGPAKYFVCSKVFSRAKICWPENVGLVCFFLGSWSNEWCLDDKSENKMICVGSNWEDDQAVDHA